MQLDVVNDEDPLPLGVLYLVIAHMRSQPGLSFVPRAVKATFERLLVSASIFTLPSSVVFMMSTTALGKVSEPEKSSSGLRAASSTISKDVSMMLARVRKIALV